MNETQSPQVETEGCLISRDVVDSILPQYANQLEQTIETTEMWFLRQILRVAWIKKKSNEKILKLRMFS